jgi:hypothetical protein
MKFKMDKTIVWSKQHVNVLNELQETGRYIAKKEYIKKDLKEHANLVLEVYNWYVDKASKSIKRPKDAEYPIWVSLSKEATMLPSKDTVILELELDPKIIMPVNINKWGTILNYSYIPKDEKDSKRHKEILKVYGTDDAQAYMSQFYPGIKKEIVKSWDLLFDDSVVIDKNKEKYGTIWEVRSEWIANVIQ